MLIYGFYVIKGDFKNCLMYLDRSLKKIEDRYGIHSLEVAYELDKISDIMVNNIDIRQNRFDFFF